MTSPDKLDWQRLQQRITEGADHGYWRSLRELSHREEDESQRHLEFPHGLGAVGDQTSRRHFLQLLGGSLALASMAGCQQPEEKIVPYVEMPEDMIPGKPLYFATAMPLHGYGLGVVVESHAGRPTKIEGNQLHPASGGATDTWAQASIHTLYDPDRSQVITENGAIASKQRFVNYLRRQLKRLGSQGAGLRLLTGRISSPTLLRQINQLQEALPEFRWHVYEPNVDDQLLAGSQLAFGQLATAVYHFERADVVFSLGGDFLNPQRHPPRYARDFMQRRRVLDSDANQAAMNRLYAVESTPSLTGAKADHRWQASPAELVRVARALAQQFGIDTAGRDATLPEGISAAWIEAAARDLREYRRAGDAGFGLVIAGQSQPAEVQAIAHAINVQLESIGAESAVHYIQPVVGGPASQVESMRELTRAIRAGEVDTLITLGGNPVFDAPADLDFASALQEVPQRIHAGLYANETSAHCQWHLPALHYLESWSDVRAYDGQSSLVQPLIAPLYSGVSEHQLLDWLRGDDQKSESPYELVRSTWQAVLGDDFEPAWNSALREGVIAGSQVKPLDVSLDLAGLTKLEEPMPAGGNSLQVLFDPDPTIDDGRFANNPWLQELPKPFTKLTWDNTAQIAPADASRLQLDNGDMVRLVAGGRSVDVAAWIMPGQTEGVVTLHYGYGREQAGKVGNNTGFNVYPLRTSDHMWSLPEVTLSKLGKSYPLAATQTHHRMEGRHPVEHGTLEQWQADPEHPPFMHETHAPIDITLYEKEEWKYEDYKWGMAVDLTSCTGCNACVVACQAENNIPVVGKQQVINGREMHWLRIDSYYAGSVQEPEVYHQPVMCMHCENAPCEVVCPVAATTHSDEGLNEMTYNRCVGTRYCANNCPYKVRRFNFLKYNDDTTPVLKLLRNPDVTVRERGVMEKCTYCVQRINHARIEADVEGRSIAAGEVVSACQSVCPTEAIQFGNLNNPHETATHWKQSPLDYDLLADQGTRPRTSYQARLSNPNPSISTHTRSSAH